jgi:hypothetical protein
MKFTFRKKDLLIGIIIGGIYTILYEGTRYVKFFDNLLWIVGPLIFSIPFLIGIFSVNFIGAYASNIIHIIAVFINSYLISIAFNKLRSKKIGYGKWLLYGLSYIGINALLFFSAWYLYIFPTIYKGIYNFFKVISESK